MRGDTGDYARGDVSIVFIMLFKLPLPPPPPTWGVGGEMCKRQVRVRYTLRRGVRARVNVNKDVCESMLPGVC